MGKWQSNGMYVMRDFGDYIATFAWAYNAESAKLISDTHNDDIDALTTKIDELQGILGRYEAKERADIDTMHEFAEYIAEKKQ